MKKTPLGSEPKAAAAGKFCPLLHTPTKNCHCYNLNSWSVSATVYYCGGRYEECEIYMRRAARQQLPEANGKGEEE